MRKLYSTSQWLWNSAIPRQYSYRARNCKIHIYTIFQSKCSCRGRISSKLFLTFWREVLEPRKISKAAMNGTRQPLLSLAWWRFLVNWRTSTDSCSTTAANQARWKLIQIPIQPQTHTLRRPIHATASLAGSSRLPLAQGEMLNATKLILLVKTHWVAKPCLVWYWPNRYICSRILKELVYSLNW